MLALLLSMAFAQFTVNIEGVGTFRQYGSFNYNNNIVEFTNFTCVKADLFSDGFEEPIRIFFRAGNSVIHPMKSFTYNGGTMTVNLKPAKAITCIQNPETLNDLNKIGTLNLITN